MKTILLFASIALSTSAANAHGDSPKTLAALLKVETCISQKTDTTTTDWNSCITAAKTGETITDNILSQIENCYDGRMTANGTCGDLAKRIILKTFLKRAYAARTTPKKDT